MDALLHVYGQDSWHGELVIVGNTAGLLHLKKIIDEALTSKTGLGLSKVEEEPSTVDGEGYEVIVKVNNADWQDTKWKKLCLPYTDETASNASNYPDCHTWYALLTESEKQLIRGGPTTIVEGK